MIDPWPAGAGGVAGDGHMHEVSAPVEVQSLRGWGLRSEARGV